MVYSSDLAYLDYFKNAAAGMYDSTPTRDRLKVLELTAGIIFIGGFRTAGRVVKLVVEIAKVIFYFLISLFTWGNYKNPRRLKDHCTLLTLNAAALIGQPLQIIIHFLAMIIGIIHPTTAYRIMQIGITPLAWITSHENKIWQQYKAPEFYTKVTEGTLSKITNIFNHCPFAMQLGMKTIVNEFLSALDAVHVAPLGYMDPFHSFGANPKTLTDKQKKSIPILLLNGNYSHQGTFLPLLYALKLSNNQRPIYTINLSPNVVQPSFLASKIAAIKSQYGKANEDLFEIDMLGHSMGSNLIQNICCESNGELPIQIRRAISVGAPFSQAVADKIEACFDIIGTKDCLNKKMSVLPEEHQKKIKTGHLNLLFHRKSLNAMVQLLE